MEMELSRCDSDGVSAVGGSAGRTGAGKVLVRYYREALGPAFGGQCREVIRWLRVEGAGFRTWTSVEWRRGI